jgi:hypothetical protein
MRDINKNRERKVMNHTLLEKKALIETETITVTATTITIITTIIGTKTILGRKIRTNTETNIETETVRNIKKETKIRTPTKNVTEVQKKQIEKVKLSPKDPKWKIVLILNIGLENDNFLRSTSSL